MLFVFLAAGLATTVLGGQCPESWSYNPASKTCVKAFSNDVEYYAARLFCLKQGADLVVPKSQASTDFLVKLTDLRKTYWIGINDQQHEGKMMYIDGTPLGSYQHWHSGEPNNLFGEDCVFMNFRGPGRWNDASCKTRTRYICEKDLASNAYTCPNNWVLYKPRNLCMTLHDTAANFEQARIHCKDQQADLVTIKDAQTHAFVLSLMRKGCQYWIGLQDRAVEGQFMHVDNTRMTFSSWRHGEPNNFFNEDCVYMLSDGKWNDLACHRQIRYICEKAATKRKPVCGKGFKLDKSGSKCITIYVPKPKPTSCPKGYKYESNDRSCIKVNSRKVSFDAARKLCQADGGDLVKITGVPMRKTINKMSQDRKCQYWIGIHSPGKDSKHFYVDGSKLSGYQPWGKNEPNNRKGAEHCVNLRYGRWFDNPCHKKYPYVCQIFI